MNVSRLPSYVQVRSGVYYVRISVPPPLRNYIGKNELKRSLNTRSTFEAARLAPATIAHFQRQIEAARKQCTPVHTAVSHVQFDQAREAAAARLERMQTLPDRSRAQGRQFLDAGAGKARTDRLAENRALVEFYEELAEGDHWGSWRVALGRSNVAAYEQEQSVRVLPGSPAYAMLSELGAQVQVEHVRRAIHRDEAFHATTPAPGSTDLFSRPNKQTSLGELLAIFRRDKEGRWRPASARAFVKVERLLLDWFGAARPVTEVTRDEWRDLFSHLPHVPVGYTRLRAFAGLPLQKVIELADAMEEPPLRLSEKSCADYAIQINSLLNWADKEGVLPKNPAKGLTPPRARAGADRRRFETDELQRLFSSTPYGERLGPTPEKGVYWLPLIALFSGMRSGEIAALKVRDVAVVEGVRCFRLRNVDALKTSYSARDVPLHPELFKLGLMAYVEKRRRSGEDELFPDIRPNGKKDRSSEFSRTFRKVLTSAGLTDPSLTMHSFRHSFAHALVALQVPLPVADALQGWGAGKPRNMFAHYGGRPPISQLAETMARVSYPGLDLSHLHTCRNPTPSSSRRQFD
jgi:integrase